MIKNSILYKMWKGYGEHKWFGKWGEGKDMRWYIYRLWIWLGNKSGYLKEYNLVRDKGLLKARRALEKAFTPQLEKLLKEESGGKNTE